MKPLSEQFEPPRDSRLGRFVRLIEEGRRSPLRELPLNHFQRRKLAIAKCFDEEMNRRTAEYREETKLPNDGPCPA